MAYTKTTWATDDVITADLLNKLETGVEEAYDLVTDGDTPVITVTATVDDTSGTPSVEVVKTGTDAAPAFEFKFYGLKGATGEQGNKGDAGTAGEDGDDAPTITAIDLVVDADGVLQSGVATFSDESIVNITVKTEETGSEPEGE